MNDPSTNATLHQAQKITPEADFRILLREDNENPTQIRNSAEINPIPQKPLHSTLGATLGGTFGKLSQQITALAARPSPGQLPPLDGGGPRTLEEELFDATAAAKILTSQVAMHLDTAWRQRLFDQLDSLHDANEWEKGDIPLQRESYSTFLKTIFILRPEMRPGLGLSVRGHLVAAWRSGESRLTIEFLPHEKVRWVATIASDGEMEYTASEMPLTKLRSRLETYAEQGWVGK